MYTLLDHFVRQHHRLIKKHLILNPHVQSKHTQPLDAHPLPKHTLPPQNRPLHVAMRSNLGSFHHRALFDPHSFFYHTLPTDCHIRPNNSRRMNHCLAMNKYISYDILSFDQLALVLYLFWISCLALEKELNGLHIVLRLPYIHPVAVE